MIQKFKLEIYSITIIYSSPLLILYLQMTKVRSLKIDKQNKINRAI